MRRGIITLVILTWALLANTAQSKAEAIYVEPVRMRVTCYTAPKGAIQASGRQVMEGTCAARRCDLGKVAVVYDENMRLVGHFEITDTGGHPRLKDGSSIDIFRDTLDRCYDWIHEYGDYMYVQIIEAEG